MFEGIEGHGQSSNMPRLGQDQSLCQPPRSASTSLFTILTLQDQHDYPPLFHVAPITRYQSRLLSLFRDAALLSANLPRRTKGTSIAQCPRGLAFQKPRLTIAKLHASLRLECRTLRDLDDCKQCMLNSGSIDASSMHCRSIHITYRVALGKLARCFVPCLLLVCCRSF